MRWTARVPRIAAGVLAFAFVALLAPRSAVACSCAAGTSVAEHIRMEPGAALIVGQVQRDRGDGSYDFAVARWYGGQLPQATLILQSAVQRNGNVAAVNTCGMQFSVGQRLLFLGQPGADGRFAPNICGLSGDPTTPEGAELEREAAAILGPARVPQPEPSEPPPVAPPSASADVAVVGAGVAVAVLALFAGVIVIGRRRRPT